MRIKELCRRCGLTKKAVAYYESRGLISPEVSENGYRDYTEKDLAVLREVAVLRRCGVEVPEVGKILAAPNRAAALERWKALADIRARRAEAARDCLEDLIRSYDVDRAFQALQKEEEDLLTIRERMLLAFPGNYGLFLSLHFGRFLEGRADTPEKRRAYAAVIGYLDGVELEMPPALSAALEEALGPIGQGVGMEELERRNREALEEVLADPEAYVEGHREELEAYLDYRTSQAFRDSPAGELQRLLLAFQERSGYREVFLENLKVLSPAYAAYQERLQAADDRFLERLPQARELFPPAGGEG